MYIVTVLHTGASNDENAFLVNVELFDALRFRAMFIYMLNIRVAILASNRFSLFTVL